MAEYYSIVYMYHVSLSIPLSMAFRLLPCPGYCKRCCSKHWGVCIFSNCGFLRVMNFSVLSKKKFASSLCASRVLVIEDTTVNKTDKNSFPDKS